MSDRNIAIVHKHYPERGGAERVADELARTFDAPVYTAFDNGASAADVEVRELFAESRASRLMQRDSWLGWLFRDLYYYLNYDVVDGLREYDVVIQSGAATSWYIPPDDQALVRYVHSPPRTAYDRVGTAAGTRIPRWYARVVRTLYPQTVSYPDIVVANSDLVARRVRRYLGREDVRVVYPPIALPDDPPDSDGASAGDYVALSRLAPNKGFDLIIDAFRRTGHDLHIVGDGPERDALERRAAGADNITFHGYVDSEEKARLLASAKALVYAAENEDFGLVPMEAFALGTPVIGVDGGFTRVQVRDGFSGVAFDRDADALVEAVERFEREGVRASPDDLRAAASECAPARFREQMKRIVDEACDQATLDGTTLWGSMAQRGELERGAAAHVAPDVGEHDV
jgi:glycosyltransferase involved in cell wall biosynthesis